MKKILFKTFGWVAMLITVSLLFTIDPFNNTLKFIVYAIWIFAINDFFDLYIGDIFLKAKDWFVK